ncbi:hypothetical protein TNCV_2036001 [Trichonephila clavipes]|nr:hypothetical protein TNCV_2036001 [Trichonephila clavipes]
MKKAEQECGLPPLESRRKLATIKFTNKLRSYGLDHISRRVFDKWKHSTGSKDLRLSNLIVKSKKNSTLDHSALWRFLQNPSFQKHTKEHLFSNWTCCSPKFQKRRPCNSQTKGLETIAILSR